MRKSLTFMLFSLFCMHLSAMVAETETSQTVSQCCIRTVGGTVVIAGENLTAEEAFRHPKLQIFGNVALTKSSDDDITAIRPGSGSKEYLEGNYNIVNVTEKNPLDHWNSLISDGKLQCDLTHDWTKSHIQYKGLRFGLYNKQDISNLEEFASHKLDGCFNCCYFPDARGCDFYHKQHNTVLDFLYCLLFICDEQSYIKSLVKDKENLRMVMSNFLNIISFSREGMFFNNCTAIISENINEELYEKLLQFVYTHNLIHVSHYYRARDLISAAHKFKELCIRFHESNPGSKPIFLSDGYFFLTLPDKYSKRITAKVSQDLDENTSREQKAKNALVEFALNENVLLGENKLTEDDFKTLDPLFSAMCGLFL